jgi:poly-gamma-glutamate biosynthesis protein PgsC/CapC
MVVDVYLALAIGCAISLLFAERFQLLPAGLVVPGYLALLANRPLSLIAVLIISLLTFFAVKYGVGRLTILYGRRKFVAMLLTGMTLSLMLGASWAWNLSAIGLIVPGLIANTMERQGVNLTLGITSLLTAVTWVILQIIVLAHLVW